MKNLSEMTKDEFELYLKEKYGPRWMFVELTQEEFDRLDPPTEEEIQEALRKGAEDYRKFCEKKNSIGVDPKLRFR